MDWIGSGGAWGPVEEASALLSGGLTANDEDPVWAQLNCLAHGDPVWLVRDREGRRGCGRERLGSWARTRSDILEELVDLGAGHPAAIEHLQRACLIPLELRLMDPTFSTLLPHEVLVLALTRLRAHPIAHG